MKEFQVDPGGSIGFIPRVISQDDGCQFMYRVMRRQAGEKDFSISKDMLTTPYRTELSNLDGHYFILVFTRRPWIWGIPGRWVGTTETEISRSDDDGVYRFTGSGIQLEIAVSIYPNPAG